MTKRTGAAVTQGPPVGVGSFPGDRRVVIRRQGPMDRRVAMVAVATDRRIGAMRRTGYDRRGVAMVAGQVATPAPMPAPPIRVIVMPPPSPDVTPPEEQGAEELDAVLASGPGNVVDSARPGLDEWRSHATAPRRIEPVAGTNDRMAPAGTSIPAPPPAVDVFDANGNPVIGVLVTFGVAEGRGTITPPGAGTTPTAQATVVRVRTNASGRAALGGWQLGRKGINRLIASADGVSTEFKATAT